MDDSQGCQSSQECLDTAWSQAFLLYISIYLVDVICYIVIHADGITLYSKYYLASDLWQQLMLAFELESSLWDNVCWDMNWFTNFNSEKNWTQGRNSRMDQVKPVEDSL